MFERVLNTPLHCNEWKLYNRQQTNSISCLVQILKSYLRRELLDYANLFAGPNLSNILKHKVFHNLNLKY